MTVAQVALSWVGREFRPGVPEMCMGFVRHVLSEAGKNPGVTKEPSDGIALKAQGVSPATGFFLANSLSGDDIGQKISYQDLQPGDIVTFHSTYGNWGPNVITHVGIAVGNGQMVHRPTRSAPVLKAAINLGNFYEGRRLGPVAMPVETDTSKLMLFFNENGFRIKVTETLEPGLYDVAFANAVFDLKK